MPSPCATCYDALHLCLTASTALLSIAANPPPSISLNPHPCLVLSCRPLLLRHHHLSSTPIPSSPPPAATTISFALPIRPPGLLLCLIRPAHHQSFHSCVPHPPPFPFVRWPSAIHHVLIDLSIRDSSLVLLLLPCVLLTTFQPKLSKDILTEREREAVGFVQ